VGSGDGRDGVVAVAVPVVVWVTVLVLVVLLCGGLSRGNVGSTVGFRTSTCAAVSCGISALTVAGAPVAADADAADASAAGSSTGLCERTHMTPLTAAIARPPPSNPTKRPVLLPPLDFGAAMNGTGAAATAAGDTAGVATVEPTGDAMAGAAAAGSGAKPDISGIAAVA
jgi:hypothetical protein